MVEPDNSNRDAISKFITGANNEVFIRVPQIPDAGNWREPHLSRSKKLIAYYEEILREVQTEARKEIEESNGQNKHIFQSTSPRYFEDGSDLDQLVVQIEHASRSPNRKHVFIEFLSKVPQPEPPIVECFELPTQSVGQRLLNYFIPKPLPPTIAEALPEVEDMFMDEPITPDQFSTQLTRVITIPPMDEDIYSKEGGHDTAFNKDLSQWWKRFFQEPTISHHKWMTQLPKRSRELTAWAFNYDDSSTITAIEYFRRNRKIDGIINRRYDPDKAPGIKMRPPNTAGFAEEHTQTLHISLENGEVRNQFTGISVHGKDQSLFEYTLQDGMLDLQGNRFGQRLWKFEDVVTDILADMPIKVQTLNPESPQEEALDL